MRFISKGEFEYNEESLKRELNTIKQWMTQHNNRVERVDMHVSTVQAVYTANKHTYHDKKYNRDSRPRPKMAI